MANVGERAKERRRAGELERESVCLDFCTLHWPEGFLGESYPSINIGAPMHASMIWYSTELLSCLPRVR
jgi:hypothetical protein